MAIVVALMLQGGLEYGYTRPAAEIDLAFAEGGVLREVAVREGRAVKAGDVLARLDTAVLEAEAEMARAQCELAERRYSALEKIAAEARVSPDELARAKAEAEIERARVKRADAAIEQRVLRSPVDGVVTEVRRDVGESVGPSDFTVLTVVRIAELRADLYVEADVAAAHKPGQAVELLYDGAVRVSATVEFVSPLVEPASGTTRVRLSIPNAEGKLLSGMKVALAGAQEE